MTAETREDLEQVFAPADLTRVGDLLIDDETGEILEWPAGVEPEGRLEWLQAQHKNAVEEEGRWKETKQSYSRALDAQLTRLGARQYVGDAHKSWAVAEGVTRDAPAERLRELLALEAVKPSEARELMWLLASDLDVKRIEQSVRNGKVERPIADFLIVKGTRAGYVRTDKVAKAAPTIAKESSRDR